MPPKKGGGFGSGEPETWGDGNQQHVKVEQSACATDTEQDTEHRTHSWKKFWNMLDKLKELVQDCKELEILLLW